jgi:hypothetical protein
MTWNEALLALVPALVALALAVIGLLTVYVKALIAKLNADSAPSIAAAVVAGVEASAKADGGWTGEQKRAEAVAALQGAKQAFAVPYIELAVAKAKAEGSK